jgi:uncharacterized protein (TIGR02117 family)
MGHVVTVLQMRRVLTACLAVAVLPILAGCQPAPPPPHQELPKADVTAYVIGDGWHTDIALPVSAITGPLQAVTHEFPTAHYLRFGWGQRTWYMAGQHTTGDALRALFPAPAAMLVTPLDTAPSSSAGPQAFAVGLTTAGTVHMSDYIWAAFEQPIKGIPGRFGFDRDPGGIFYAAHGTYSATYTCNTWTADALRAGGIPVNSAGVVFAGQLTNQVEALPATVN